MENKDKEIIKPDVASTKPAMKQPRWPNQGSNAGIKNSKSIHGRMPTGRGSARGR